MVNVCSDLGYFICRLTPVAFVDLISIVFFSYSLVFYVRSKIVVLSAEVLDVLSMFV